MNCVTKNLSKHDQPGLLQNKTRVQQRVSFPQMKLPVCLTHEVQGVAYYRYLSIQ